MAEGQVVRITVTYSPAPREVLEWQVVLAPGATVGDGLRASGLKGAFPALDISQASVGVWGRKAVLGEQLQDGDRVEIYRPLKVDPKLARRERFREQGIRAAGLFARKKA